MLIHEYANLRIIRIICIFAIFAFIRVFVSLFILFISKLYMRTQEWCAMMKSHRHWLESHSRFLAD